ncbi:uncharacterized protein LOC127279744 [Leptopilina boulardi]|uniref:uncharacterized protein LOC127279744 n=1 Tax=Leptopilina boulardi TaxID=63433 RepID=UPI0021F56B4A|nr:uncharacterized protein LOC127279744 [Leptopilina boulardi]
MEAGKRINDSVAEGAKQPPKTRNATFLEKGYVKVCSTEDIKKNSEFHEDLEKCSEGSSGNDSYENASKPRSKSVSRNDNGDNDIVLTETKGESQIRLQTICRKLQSRLQPFHSCQQMRNESNVQQQANGFIHKVNHTTPTLESEQIGVELLQINSNIQSPIKKEEQKTEKTKIKLSKKRNNKFCEDNKYETKKFVLKMGLKKFCKNEEVRQRIIKDVDIVSDLLIEVTYFVEYCLRNTEQPWLLNTWCKEEPDFSKIIPYFKEKKHSSKHPELDQLFKMYNEKRKEKKLYKCEHRTHLLQEMAKTLDRNFKTNIVTHAKKRIVNYLFSKFLNENSNNNITCPESMEEKTQDKKKRRANDETCCTQ